MLENISAWLAVAIAVVGIGFQAVRLRADLQPLHRLRIEVEVLAALPPNAVLRSLWSEQVEEHALAIVLHKEQKAVRRSAAVINASVFSGFVFFMVLQIRLANERPTPTWQDTDQVFVIFAIMISLLIVVEVFRYRKALKIRDRKIQQHQSAGTSDTVPGDFR